MLSALDTAMQILMSPEWPVDGRRYGIHKLHGRSGRAVAEIFHAHPGENGLMEISAEPSVLRWATIEIEKHGHQVRIVH